MPLFSAFTPLGHYALSSRKPIAQSIYESLRDSFGDTYNESFDGRQQARLYAQAMCLASARLQLDRAANNRNPAKATELLPALEKDFQVTPAYNSTLKQRRDVLVSRSKLTRGSRREAIEEALRTLLGTDFIRYETIDDPADIVTWPPSPGNVGIFAAAGAQKKAFSIDTAVSLTGIPLTLAITLLGNSDGPIPGETYCVDPDSRGAPEQIVIESAFIAGNLPDSPINRIRAIFTRAHEPHAPAVRPHPLWISNQRYSRVIVSFAAAGDPETRRKINDYMARAVRGVSQWAIGHDNGTFILDSSTRGVLSSTQLA